MLLGEPFGYIHLQRNCPSKMIRLKPLKWLLLNTTTDDTPRNTKSLICTLLENIFLLNLSKQSILHIGSSRETKLHENAKRQDKEIHDERGSNNEKCNYAIELLQEIWLKWMIILLVGFYAWIHICRVQFIKLSSFSMCFCWVVSYGQIHYKIGMLWISFRLSAYTRNNNGHEHG